MGETSSLSHIKSTLTESPSIVSNRRLDSAPSNEWTRRVVEVEEKKRLIHDDKAQAHAQAHDKPAASLLLLNLPVDPLHCIAGFLTCSEWADFGKTSHAANRACREIFKRVKLHGFRCAAEVISAWVRFYSHIFLHTLHTLHTPAYQCFLILVANHFHLPCPALPCHACIWMHLNECVVSV